MTDTLKLAKQHLLVAGRKGTSCPCCGQFVKLYKRKLSTVMARGLISLHHLCKGNTDYHHVSKIMTKISPTGSNDFSKLRYHGFIEEELNTNSAKKTSGNWRITPAGVAFVHKQLLAREYMLIYNTKLKGFEGDPINIEQALGNKFNYQELLTNS